MDFVLRAGPDGALYRLNRRTGETWLRDGERWLAIAEPGPGQWYFMPQPATTWSGTYQTPEPWLTTPTTTTSLDNT